MEHRVMLSLGLSVARSSSGIAPESPATSSMARKEHRAGVGRSPHPEHDGTHKTQLIRNWLAKRPRFHFHFTPTSVSWLNLVDR
jgi:hypothetical protein